MPELHELVSQYTEDAIANEDRVCDRPACRAPIQKGEPCHYVATVNPGQTGHQVCGACLGHYQKKAATHVRPTGNYLLSGLWTSWLT